MKNKKYGKSYTIEKYNQRILKVIIE